MTTTPARDERRQRWEDAMAGPIANPRLIQSAATEGMHLADQEAAEVRAAAFDQAADWLVRRYGVTNLAAGDLRRMAAAERADNTTGA